jgi:hypothetical protein
MTARGPAEQEPRKSETYAFLVWVLSTWSRSLRAVLLISAPIIGVLIFIGIAMTVIFYLKVDPQRWGAALGLTVIAAGVARTVISVRNRMKRHRISSSAENAPSGTQDITGAEREPSAASEGDADDNLGD